MTISSWARRIGLVASLFLCGALGWFNALSLSEGAYYLLRNAVSHRGLEQYVAAVPNGIAPLQTDGRYAALYDLIHARNLERYAYLASHLRSLGLSVEEVPIPDSPYHSLLVRFRPDGPYTVFSAHYDKLYDDRIYEGASDNTAAVAVLFASVNELARQAYRGSAAFLFTGEEEKGLLGAAAFLRYAQENALSIREDINFDNLGRGRLALRPLVAIPGFVLTLPLGGDVTFDGRVLSRTQPYLPVNERLGRAVVQAQPQTAILRRFTALSDANVFQAAGVDTVTVSGDDMYYLELTWHTYQDRVDLVDERNLDLAFDLIIRYAGRP